MDIVQKRKVVGENLKRKVNKIAKTENLIGQRFGRLVVIKRGQDYRDELENKYYGEYSYKNSVKGVI